ncbi:MAG: ABC transporter ATP-binding protein [Myxococcales bacterium]|nr:ABC transporter ATP-binding protein [Myxococcales bacterium]
MFAAARRRLFPWTAAPSRARSSAPIPRDRWASATVFASLQGVSVAYDDGRRAVLEDLSLDIPRGSVTCLVGPSGGGKSTILNLVAGLTRPTRGAVRSDVAAGSRVGVVFQEAGLMPWLTLLDNVAFPLALAGVDRTERRERAAEMLRTVHLLRFRDAFPHELSGGMQQRGALARALVTDPPAILFDEPFAALDAEMRALLQDEVERVFLASRKTLLFVTHDVSEAVRLGDRVVVLGARPARVLETVHVDAPRPRAASDAAVLRAVREVTAHIKAEVDKIKREEADDGWCASQGDAAADPRRHLGRGI